MSDKPNFFQTNRQLIVYSALFALVMAIYYQTIGFKFINLDDNLYIFNNQTVLSGLNTESVKWAFTQFAAANWHPVTWLSHLIDVELFGQNSGGHHATNVVLHLINSILAFTVFQKMTGSFWKSAIVAALFAVHPTHVESVAWVSERKDVLSTMFWLLVMFAYVKYAESRGEEEKRRGGEEERKRRGEEENEHLEIEAIRSEEAIEGEGATESEGEIGGEEATENKNAIEGEKASENTKTNKSEIVAENTKTNESENAAENAITNESEHVTENKKGLFSKAPLLLFSSSALLFYSFVFLLFALGLMSKPMLVTLPCVLLLMDYWALERLKTLRDLPFLILEKIPLFILSGISSYITLIAQRSAGAVESLDYLPITTRLLNAMLSYAKYTGMMFYPVNLGVWYPYDRNFPAWQLALAAIFIVSITALCLWQIKRRKYLLMGWLWFLGTLVPVIGIVQVGSQPLADRYTYVPYFGLFIMLVWGIADLFKYFKINKIAYFGLFGIFIIALSGVGFKQTSYWQNNEILYKHTLAVTEKNFLISHNLCHHLTLEDRMDEAEPFCRQSIADKPDYFEVYNTLGILQLKRKEFAEAEKSFKECLKYAPDYAFAISNLGVVQIMQDRPEEGEQNLKKASELPGSPAPSIFASALYDLAVAYAKKDNFEKTAEALTRVVYLTPENSDARLRLALVFVQLKRYDDAQTQFEELLRLNPQNAEFYNLYGLLLLEKKQNAEAVRQFEKALQLNPNFAEAKTNLEKAKGK